ncbi:MAG: hypothetical protein Q9173_000432 [Seirophora scorigena]
MNIPNLTDRLQTINEAYKQTLHLIHRLSKLPATPGSSSLDPEAADARLELSAEIHQSLKEQEEEFELLRQEVDDQTGTASWTSSARRRDSERERERTALAAQVARLGEDQKLARSQFRKAQLQAKRNAEAANRKERELLFARVQDGETASGSGRRKGQEQISKDQLEANASADVTAALRRVHSLMQSEVSKSQFALETLRGSFISQSKYRKSDTWYLESAFWILVVTIGWLVFRRILYGPGWWLLYLPTTVLWRLTSFAIRFVHGASGFLAAAVGAKSQGTSIVQASQRITSNLQEQPTATEAIPTINRGMTAPSIGVGGGGKGQPRPQPAQKEQQSMSDIVAEMAEKASEVGVSSGTGMEQNEQGTTLRERGSDEPPNPKKRMLEEKIQIMRGMSHEKLEALRGEWKRMYGETLPSLAVSKSPVQDSWPVHVDHCFGRIILDTVVGRDSPWMNKIKSPAVKTMTSEQLEACFALGTAIAEGKESLAMLDAKSLQLRGKKQKPAAVANRKRKREDEPSAADHSPEDRDSARKKRQVDIKSALLSPSKKVGDHHPPRAAAPPAAHSRVPPKSNNTIDPDLERLITTSDLTPFRQSVLLALCQVPSGQFTSYAAMAQHLRSSARAVGNALRNNPFAPRVPCHRVVAADKSLGGFGGEWGMQGKHAGEKVRLLREEGVVVDTARGKVDGYTWSSFR